MHLKTKAFAAASTLAVVGGMFVAAAPAAHAAPTTVGSCGGSVDLIKLKPALGDQTQVGLKASGGLAKDQTTKTAIAGSCSAPARPGDSHIPQPSGALTPKAQAVSLLGNASCASGASAIAADATAAFQWPLNGKITWTMTQTYADLVTTLVHPYKIQAGVVLLGFNPGFQDVVDVGGLILTGLAPGASVTGQIWEDPVSKTGGASGYNTGYELDLTNALGCADGTPNNASIAQVLSGGGGASNTSLLGSSPVNGLSFTVGE